MHLDGKLAVVQAQAMALGARVVADQTWLTAGFLHDKTLSPARYLDLAARHKARERRLLALTERLLADAPMVPVA